MKLTYPKADSYIAISQGVKEGLIEKLKLEERKIEVIYNPTDIKYLQEKASCEVPSHINICNNNFNICISGRLSKQKNHTMLISSIHNINKELRKNIRIYVLGIGPLEKDIKSKVFDLGLSDNFIFCGYLTNPFSITSKCQLSVLTSLYEGFGNVITESLAVGTPVISTNCKSGPSEIIIDNFNGYLVNVNDHIQLSDKILFLMSNKSVLQNLSDNCVESINKFEVSLILNQYINHIDNIDKNKNISTKL
jgi:glycosyltransferase involved in cell wall biosynthesis